MYFHRSHVFKFLHDLVFDVLWVLLVLNRQFHCLVEGLESESPVTNAFA